MALAVALNLTSDSFHVKHELKFLSLDYPCLQAVNFDLPSYSKHEDGPGIITKRRMTGFWTQYAVGSLDFHGMFFDNDHITKELRDTYKDRVNTDFLPGDFLSNWKPVTDPYNSRLKNSNVTELIRSVVTNPMFSPLLAKDEDLAKLPFTYVLTTEYDVLRDEGFMLVERLNAVGVDVRHLFLPYEAHGFLTLGADRTESFKQEIINFATIFNEAIHG